MYRPYNNPVALRFSGMTIKFDSASIAGEQERYLTPILIPYAITIPPSTLNTCPVI
jgi:hypothetical protein